MVSRDKQAEELEPDKKRVREAILAKGLKVKQFSDLSGIPYPSLRDYYSGTRKPGFEALAAIIAHSGVAAEWLLMGTGPMFPGQYKEGAEIDENLLGRIAMLVKREYLQPNANQLEVAQQGESDGLYGQAEISSDLRHARELALVAANVYNRVANLADKAFQDLAIEKEVARMVRFHRNVQQT